MRDRTQWGKLDEAEIIRQYARELSTRRGSGGGEVPAREYTWVFIKLTWRSVVGKKP